MKTIYSVIWVFILLAFVSCEGPAGEDGLDGDSLVGQVIEINGELTPGNDGYYQLEYFFPSDITVYESDVVMVYLRWASTDFNGHTFINWKPLPITEFLDDGYFRYSFDYSQVGIYIQFDTNNTKYLNAANLSNLNFRIAILPAGYVKNNHADLQNYERMMSEMKAKNIEIRSFKAD